MRSDALVVGDVIASDYRSHRGTAGGWQAATQNDGIGRVLVTALPAPHDVASNDSPRITRIVHPWREARFRVSTMCSVLLWPHPGPSLRQSTFSGMGFVCMPANTLGPGWPGRRDVKAVGGCSGKRKRHLRLVSRRQQHAGVAGPEVRTCHAGNTAKCSLLIRVRNLLTIIH